MELSREEEEPILFQCMVPKTVSVQGLEATDFIRKHVASMFCHIRFTRPMLEGDSVEIRVTFHGIPQADGQCLLSVTPPELRNSKAKTIVNNNPFVIDPTTAWISYLKDDDTKKCMQFGIKYMNGTIQLRLPGDSEFFTFYHVQDENDLVCIDMFFCEYVKSVALRDPVSAQYSEEAPLIYQKRSSVLIV